MLYRPPRISNHCARKNVMLFVEQDTRIAAGVGMDIRVELQDMSSVKKRLKVEVPADAALRELNQVADEYKRHAKVPGFRLGKVPMQLIKRHFRKRIREDVIQKLIPQSYDQAIHSKGIEPLGEPNLENLTFEEGEPLVYEANFEVRPKIDLPEFKGLEIRVEPRTVTETDIQKQLEKLREQHSRLVSIEDRPLQEGDYAIIDLKGKYLGTDQGSGQEAIHDQDVTVKMGDAHTHEAFNRSLLGVGIGETRQFEVEYAADYPEEKLAGHKVLFAAQVNDVKKKELPDLNDDFAKDLGDFESLEQLSRDIEARLQVEQEKSRDSELKDQLTDKLIRRTTFEVPDTLVEDQIDSMIREMAYRIAYQGVDPSKANIDWVRVRSDYQPEAEKTVRANLILAEIAKSESVEVSPQELENRLEEVAKAMDQPQEKVQQHFQQDHRMEGLKSRIRREKVLETLLENAKVVEA